MPEGPSILFLKNKLQRFKGKIVSEVSGEAEIDQSIFEKALLIDIQTFGKSFLFLFKEFFLAIEITAVGNLLVNKQKKMPATISFKFEENELNFYNAETKIYKGKPTDYFNFKIDISKPEFDAAFVLSDLQKFSEDKIGEALLNQNILAGIGNIIRTETLYHAKIHPESLIKSIPEKKLIFLLKMIQDYAEEILTLLKTDSVEKNALIFEKKNCPKDKSPILMEEIGAEKVKTYICPKCQKIFK